MKTYYTFWQEIKMYRLGAYQMYAAYEVAATSEGMKYTGKVK